MPKSRQTDTSVAIVGGGISGLAAAYELQKLGISHLVLERTNRLGGVIHTETESGFVIDGGPDSLLVQKPAAIRLCHELGLGDRLIPTGTPRTAYVLRQGVLHPLAEGSVLGIPLKPTATSGLLSEYGNKQMALEVTMPPLTSDQDESIGSFFRRRFGNESVDYIADPLLAGIHAGDVEKLSVHSLFPRLVEMERQHDSVIKGLRLQKSKSPSHSDGMFRSLPGGLVELTNALISALDRKIIKTEQCVVDLKHFGGLSLTMTNGNTIKADHVILTTPAFITARLLEPIDSTLAGLCKEIPYTSTATVALSYPEDCVTDSLDGTGFVVPRVEKDYTLMAGSWISTKWPGRAPNGQILVRGFVGGARDKKALEHSDDELVAAAHDDFRVLLGISGRPALQKVYRWPQANPQHEVGHRDRLTAIDERLAKLPGIHITGSGFRGVGIPDCVANGRATATAISNICASSTS